MLMTITMLITIITLYPSLLLSLFPPSLFSLFPFHPLLNDNLYDDNNNHDDNINNSNSGESSNRAASPPSVPWGADGRERHDRLVRREPLPHWPGRQRHVPAGPPHRRRRCRQERLLHERGLGGSGRVLFGVRGSSAVSWGEHGPRRT